MVNAVRTPLATFVAAALLVAVPASTAHAQERDARERDAREIDAKKACLAGKPDRGIELLAELYAETNDATYIYNQGRCFEQNGKAGDALTRFREYLRKSPALSPDESAQVQAHIADMENQARQASAATPAPASSPAAATATTPAAAPARDTGRDLRVAGIATASAGVLLVGAGIFFGVRTKALESDVTADAKRGAFSQSKYDEGQRDHLLQWIGYGVGAAALLSGGMLYVFGAQRGATEAGRVTAMPALTPGGGVGCRLRVIF